jgi:hypothetical protein
LFIPDPDPHFLPIPDPGVKNAPDPESGSARLEMRRVPCLLMPLASSLLMSMLRWLFLLAFLLILLNIDVPGKEEKNKINFTKFN